MRNKVKGMLVGGAIGDAWGKPVETWTPEKILEVHPEGVDCYKPPIGHKWFKEEEHPPGTTTDDTQLTVAVMRGIVAGIDEAIERDNYNIIQECIGTEHVKALKTSDAGWGNTTREAVRKICNGCPWYKAGAELNFGGTGNGVPMRVSPFGALLASPKGQRLPTNFNHQMVRHAAMTHATDMAAFSGVIHANVIHQLLTQGFDQDAFFDLVSDRLWELSEDKNKLDPGFYSVEDLRHIECEKEDNLEHRMLWLFQRRTELPQMDRDVLRERFGKGSCYVLDSLPFSYAFFLKNPLTPQAIRDVIEAGGDTDTNGKIVGEMIGAVHGIEKFQSEEWQWTVDGLVGVDGLLELADEFCDKLEIE